jgi:Zn-finger nucleic acid-binding protein
MKCPQDRLTLTMSERSGVEIDHCPKCRGVWLDRGELDKILERSERDGAPPQQTVSGAERRPTSHMKKNWLSEVFELEE